MSDSALSALPRAALRRFELRVLRVLLEDNPVGFVPGATGAAPPRPAAASLTQLVPSQKSTSRDTMIVFAAMSHSRVCLRVRLVAQEDTPERARGELAAPYFGHVGECQTAEHAQVDDSRLTPEPSLVTG